LNRLSPHRFEDGSGRFKSHGRTGACIWPAEAEKQADTRTTIRSLRTSTDSDVVNRSTEVDMDWNRVEGNWKQVKGKVKEKWGKLTDDDLNVINGRRDQLEGKIQERYGLARDQIRNDVDYWYSRQKW
jgi:uncharacterized protein YjbJ (UPF0337 family)